MTTGSGRESWGELRHMWAWRRSTVRFYSIGTAGLKRGSNTSRLSQMNPMGTAGEIRPAPTTDEEGESIGVDTGATTSQDEDFKSALRRLRDTSMYYVLGYTPQPKFDGS